MDSSSRLSTELCSTTTIYSKRVRCFGDQPILSIPPPMNLTRSTSNGQLRAETTSVSVLRHKPQTKLAQITDELRIQYAQVDLDEQTARIHQDEMMHPNVRSPVDRSEDEFFRNFVAVRGFGEDQMVRIELTNRL